MLIFDHVTKVFGNGNRAIDDVNFTVENGEFVILEGHSGAGKTSLIRMTIKEFPVTSGKIFVDGDDIGKIGPRNIPLLRRKIGVVFQDFKVLMDRTVAENIDLALDILGLEDSVIEKRREELLDLTGILEKQNDFPIQLSGGQLQRVVIARALAGAPKLLFADEPTAHLDSHNAEKIIELLRQVNTAFGKTIVLVTHEPAYAKMADRIVYLIDGTVSSIEETTIPQVDWVGLESELRNEASAPRPEAPSAIQDASNNVEHSIQHPTPS